MAALTKDRRTPSKAQGTHRHHRRKIGAVKVFKGGIAAKNAAGFLVPASDATALVVVGIFEETVDNSAGVAGDKEANYLTGCEVELENAGGAIVQSTHGCYVADDQSVTTKAVSVNKVFVGIVAAFTATKVHVYIDEDNLGVLGDDRVGAMTYAAAAPAVGVPLVAMFEIPDAASADYDIAVPEAIEVLDVLAQKTGANGGAANTVQVKNAANAISDALSLNINDQALARAAAINDANSRIAAGGTLRLSTVKAGGNAACKVKVTYIKRGA